MREGYLIASQMSYKYFFVKNDQDVLKEFVRVNHAGEVGAVKICEGQVAGLSKSKDFSENRLDILQEMFDSEHDHMQFFVNSIKSGGLHPSFMIGVWSKLAYWMGYLPMRMGYDYGMICTYAIETAIYEHYTDQIKAFEYLSESQISPEFREKVEQFRDDEGEHRDEGEPSMDYKSITKKSCYYTISFITKLAIIISSKL